jgi:hypothetical protein
MLQLLPALRLLRYSDLKNALTAENWLADDAGNRHCSVVRMLARLPATIGKTGYPPCPLCLHYCLSGRTWPEAKRRPSPSPLGRSDRAGRPWEARVAGTSRRTGRPRMAAVRFRLCLRHFVPPLRGPRRGQRRGLFHRSTAAGAPPQVYQHSGQEGAKQDLAEHEGRTSQSGQSATFQGLAVTAAARLRRQRRWPAAA